MLMPGEVAPALVLPVAGGGTWDLLAGTDDRFRLVAFFRGGFCRYCREWIKALDAATGDFAARGIEVVAASMDDVAAARDMAALVGLSSLTLCHGLTEADARRWQLFLSRRKLPGGDALVLHAEPALFLVSPDRRIYVVIQQSVSFGRPDIASLLSGFDVLKGAGFPVRGNA